MHVAAFQGPFDVQLRLDERHRTGGEIIHKDFLTNSE